MIMHLLKILEIELNFRLHHKFLIILEMFHFHNLQFSQISKIRAIFRLVRAMPPHLRFSCPERTIGRHWQVNTGCLLLTYLLLHNLQSCLRMSPGGPVSMHLAPTKSRKHHLLSKRLSFQHTPHK